MGEGDLRLYFSGRCVGTVLGYYNTVYNLMEYEYVCISCRGCRPSVGNRCLRSEPLCQKWIVEELKVKKKLDRNWVTDNPWVVEVIHRIARRLVGFAIAEMEMEKRFGR